jgi:hypothetical protein
MRHEPIRDPNLFGERYTHGDRMVEVIRTDQDTWMIYAKIAGKVCKSKPEDPTTKKTCMDWKKRFLSCAITPETW